MKWLAPFERPAEPSQSYATAEWQQERDGWLYRQQQWGEPSSFPHAYAHLSRGVLWARGWEVAALVDEACGHQPQEAAA